MTIITVTHLPITLHIICDPQYWVWLLYVTVIWYWWLFCDDITLLLLCIIIADVFIADLPHLTLLFIMTHDIYAVFFDIVIHYGLLI